MRAVASSLCTAVRWASSTHATDSPRPSSRANPVEAQTHAAVSTSPSSSSAASNPARASTPLPPMLTLERQVNWGGSHDARRVPAALAGRHQVQRILRRLPLGCTDGDLYVNELPSNLKEDLVKAAYFAQGTPADTTHVSSVSTTRRCHRGSAAPPTALTPGRVGAHPLRELVVLRGPHVTVAREKIMAHRRHAEKHTARSRDHADTTPKRSSTEVTVPETIAEASLALPALTHTSASIGLGWHTPACGPSSLLEGVMVTTQNTATRAQYLSTPMVYLLGVPEALCEADDAHTHVNWLQRLLLFDSASQELLLRTPQPSTNTSTTPAEALSAHVFLVQTFSFSPHAVHRAMCQEAAQGQSTGRYRLFFLAPAAGLAEADAGVWHLLNGSGVLYPSCFTSYHVDVDTCAPRHRAGEAAEPSLWTPLRMKRLRKDSESTGPDLWSSQVSGGRMHGRTPSASSAPSSSSSLAQSPRLTSSEKLRELRRVFASRQLELVRRAALRGDGGVHAETTSSGSAAACTRLREPTVDATDTARVDAVHASAVRRARVSFVVSEYHVPGLAVTAPSMASPAATGHEAHPLPHMLHEALFHQQPPSWSDKVVDRRSHTAAGHAVPPWTESTTPLPLMSSPSPALFLPTASAALMFARERVLLPFLRRPRADWGGSETRQGSRWVWSPAALEELAEWRARFQPRFGPFLNLLSAELVVGLGRAVPASVMASVTATMSPALVLLHDRLFIESVLLPAMYTYAVEHLDTDTQRGLLTSRTRPSPDAGGGPSWSALALAVRPEDVLKRLHAEPELAAAVQYRRLHSWLRRLAHAPAAQRDAWLLGTPLTNASDQPPRDPHADDGDGEEDAVEGGPAAGTLHKLPVSIQPFFQRAYSYPQESCTDANEAALETIRVIPIRPFLHWLARDAAVVFTDDDEQQTCLYLASWGEYFTLAGGLANTVAFSHRPSARRQ